MYAKVSSNDTVIKYPYTLADLKRDHAAEGFKTMPADDVLAAFGIVPVTPTREPDHDITNQWAVWGTPAKVNSVWLHVWNIVPLSAEETANRVAALQNDVRSTRNDLLKESDWTQIADAPSGGAWAGVDKAAWATYRQQLRDVPAQSGFPANVTWPVKPE